ncbi:MAG TPA: thioredoxin domain-containing protein [Lacunisphaera sp.]|nr:thioredoxin domain-containing protein [Lacunisphaera sp.]
MPNRLAAEPSPYLRQHADNPVDWYPWGAEAFARARAEQKPIFLSIGYSTCHWCHVMAHESFENPAIAAVLNRDFVPVKLDREERPDIDRIYMTYVQQTTGHGGWPMSVWLTPDLKPFFGGTYFPPEDRHSRPGFLTLLHTIARHWAADRAKIEHGAEEVLQALRRYAVEGGAREIKDDAAELHDAAGAAFEQCHQYFYETFDEAWGGFGGAPKFPRASVINFLLRAAVLQGLESPAGAEAVRMAAHTLQRMAEGGLQDHVGGGFHRYSVDERWFVPHFEKMLYDQAQIAVNLLEARQATGRETYAWVARDLFAYVARELTSPEGGFYSADDADSIPPEAAPRTKEQGASTKEAEHAEGAFYVWTKAEIEQVLGGDAAFFCAHFGVKDGGNVAQDPQGEFTGKNVLMQQQSLAVTARECGLETEAAGEKLLDCFERLRRARSLRPPPHRDDKVITAWNGLMISALARAAQVLDDPARPAVAPYLAAATRAAEFIQRELFDGSTGTLFRSWRGQRGTVPGFAEDYACLIQGLLDLYESGFEIRWLQWAERLQARMDELFWDDAGGGYFNSRGDDAAVIVRLKEDYDGAEPAANSVAISNLVRLDWMLGLAGAREKALRTIAALRPQWRRAPQALPQLLCSLELALAEPRTVVLAGDPASESFRRLAGVLQERLGPRRAILHADGGAGQQWLAARRPYLAAIKASPDGAVAIACEGMVCRPSAHSEDDLRALLD